MRRIQLRLAFFIVLIAAASLNSVPAVSAQTVASQRGLQDASSPPASTVQLGPYYALVIGNNNYRYLHKLQTAVNDANAVAQLLQERYGFTTKVLRDATRNDILTALTEYRRTLPENSNLLIYYAGHGQHDRDTDEAYWLPVDAQSDNNANWISADDITRDVKAVSSLHVLIIADSCYSGALTRDADVAINPRERSAFFAKMRKSKSRNLMSSGGDEPVADSGAGGHSVFAGAILESLSRMEDDEFTASNLFDRLIQPVVGGRSDQLPQYSYIRNSGHDAGDFVFSRSSTPPPWPPGVSPAVNRDLVATVISPKPGPSVRAAPDLIDSAKKLYESGDYTSALPSFKQASEAGNAEALAYLGDYYSTRWPRLTGLTKNDVEAVRRYRNAAEAGDARGMTRLGQMYSSGSGVEQNDTQALSWFRKAAQAGDTLGMTDLGLMYESGKAVDKDYSEALRWFRKAADAGDMHGMNHVGCMYEHGRGVEKDYSVAVRWFHKAAAAGNAMAMNNLGNMYLNGTEVGRDYAEALRWYRRAVEAPYGPASGESGGDLKAMNNLGFMYAHGYGVDKDFAAAVRWWRQAADAGDGLGMSNLGVMYENGDGVPKDYEEAVRWFRKAADADEARGMGLLGFMYEHGYGVKKNYAEALRWYRKSARLGDEYALGQLKRLGEKPAS
jgi:TPR repeat protein